MPRFYTLFGFAMMLGLMNYKGNLNKFINMKYAYFSYIAIIILIFLCFVQLIHVYKLEKKQERENPQKEFLSGENQSSCACHDFEAPIWKKGLSYLVLSFPIFTGIFLPIETLDSSFIKAKGFSFIADNASFSEPGTHQFLKPDSRPFYGKEGYEHRRNQDLADFIDLPALDLQDHNFMKGMEAIYNFPGEFIDRKISFNGFAYHDQQSNSNHYFILRFGFIHCAADSGVFGVLVDFPKGTKLKNDQWLHVQGTLTSEFYPPFKQILPIVRATNWEKIKKPAEPYIYRFD